MGCLCSVLKKNVHHVSHQYPIIFGNFFGAVDDGLAGGRSPLVDVDDDDCILQFELKTARYHILVKRSYVLWSQGLID